MRSISINPPPPPPLSPSSRRSKTCLTARTRIPRWTRVIDGTSRAGPATRARAVRQVCWWSRPCWLRGNSADHLVALARRRFAPLVAVDCRAAAAVLGAWVGWRFPALSSALPCDALQLLHPVVQVWQTLVGIRACIMVSHVFLQAVEALHVHAARLLARRLRVRGLTDMMMMIRGLSDITGWDG